MYRFKKFATFSFNLCYFFPIKKYSIFHLKSNFHKFKITVADLMKFEYASWNKKKK